MKSKETIFKEAIRSRLDDQLRNIGYKKDDDRKGFIKYVCSNNYLKFVFEWNQTSFDPSDLIISDGSEDLFSLGDASLICNTLNSNTSIIQYIYLIVYQLNG